MSRSASQQLDNLGLPEELKIKLMEAATRNNRSAAEEVITRLEETFSREDIAEAKAARDALLVELGDVLQAGLAAADDLNEVQTSLRKAQKILDAKRAASHPSKENPNAERDKVVNGIDGYGIPDLGE